MTSTTGMNGFRVVITQITLQHYHSRKEVLFPF